LRAAKLADTAGFEALLALARWKGLAKAGIQHRGGVVLDPVVAAGISMATTIPRLRHQHAPTVHPLIVREGKSATTITCRGALRVNVVGGWNRPEFDMFGLPLAEHDAPTIISTNGELLQRLWSADGRVRLRRQVPEAQGEMSMPQPAPAAAPAIMTPVSRAAVHA